jgi:hypothetical protein
MMSVLKNRRQTVSLFFFLLLLTPSLQKQCPLGLTNGTCNDSAVCAIFIGNPHTCTGWANYRCTRGQYRDLKTCECVNCPSGSGGHCTPENECCSLNDCGLNNAPAPSTTPKPKWALSPAPRRAAHVAIGILLAVTLGVWCS